jgi:predicted aspartyl protease
MSDDPIIQDTSRVDNFLRSRHRVEVLNAAWKPALAGAAGAVAIIGAVVVGVWVAGPRFTYREVEIPKVTYRDVTVPNIITKDVEIPIPRVSAPPPIAANPPDAPTTSDEKKFVATPEYQGATYKGRLIKSRDGKEISFVDGHNVRAGHWDGAKVVLDLDGSFTTDPYVGDLSECLIDKHGLWFCKALHNGQEVYITDRPDADAVSTQDTSPVTSSVDTITVDVDLGDGSVAATVDTGCGYPLSIPSVLANGLVKRNLATRAGSTRSVLADGSAVETDVVMIKAVTVAGRALRDVEAVVSPSSAAPILLGLAALSRLGNYKFEAGRLVFTSEGRPT